MTFVAIGTLRVKRLGALILFILMYYLIHTVKSVLSSHSKIDITKILMTNGSLMNGRKYCRMLPLEHSAVLLTCIK